MPFDGSGNYNPAAAPNFPAIGGATISSAYYNNVINDIATALSNCLTRDGQGRPTANIDWNAKNLSNVGALAAASLGLTAPLTVANGGTGAASLTSGYLPKGAGTGAYVASIVYENAGNIGIGTATPSSKLSVVGSADGEIARFQRGGGTNLPIARFNVLETGNLVQLEATGAVAPVFQIWTGGASRLHIDTSGNVGIGTTAPGAAYRLDIRYDGNNFRGMRIYNADTGASAVAYLQFGNDLNATAAYLGLNSNAGTQVGGNNALVLVNGLAAPLILGTSNSERMRIDSSGNVGIGVAAFGTNAAGVLGLTNAIAPTTSPANMGQLYVETGALKFRGSTGTVTVIAPA